ncbi:phage tail protein, partial [Variovorax sp. tm]|uniref:phage tail protein n=1 Tax=Variovorax atrisoli TaxID=3394203 RepID=UPI003A7F9156
SLTAAEDARIIAAANACDTPIDYGAGAVAMYRAASVIPFGSAARDAMDDLSQAMGGEWAYAGGEYFVRAGVYQLPVMFLDERDLAVVQRSNDGSVSQSGITISPHRARNDKFNTVAIRIWDQAANYVQTPITPFRADALVADDGAEIAQEVTMPAVFSGAQAYHIAGIMLRDSRDPLTVTLPFKMRAYQLELFDTIALTLARYGWVMKQFRVMARTFSPEGLVQLTLKETNYQIYAYGAGFVPAGYSQNSGLPKPWDIHPPAITAISSGEGELIVQTDGTVVNAVRVMWSQIYDQSISNGGTVEVQYRVLPDGQWISVTAPGDATEVKFSGVDDLALILIRARTRNSLAVSDWGAQQLHQVIGKTDPPPNVENLSISADGLLSWSLPRRVPDLAGYVFRFHYGQNLDWNSAAPLHTGLVTDSPWQPDNRPGGVVTIMVKAQDTSGNQSFLVGSVVMNLGDPPIANVVESWNYDAMGWPYDAAESSGWAIVSGDPTANPLDSFYGSDDQAFYGGDTAPFYKAEAYAQMVYVTPPLSIGSALAGSIMTLVADVQGVDLRIEYRFAGPGAFYGPDSDSFYGPDADPRYGDAGPWQPWPGQLAVANDVYQFRVTIGAGA